MKMERKGISAFLCMVILAAAYVMSGCASSVAPSETETLMANQYYVYYKSGSSYTLSKAVCETEGTSRQELVKELFHELQTPEDTQWASAVPRDLLLVSTYFEDTTLILNFSTNYTSMSAIDEVLCRTAIVETMLQIDGIDGVSFNVADQPLLSNSGKTIGVMSADSFEDSINQTLKETELVLYFADETGTGLKAEHRTVVYRSGQSMERLVVEELIDGPEEAGCYPVLDAGLKVTGVSVSDNVCYVYFDDTFLQNSLDVADYIPIYAIVNSLSELSNTSRVQFVISGNQNAIFRESISLSGTLSRNLNYIIQE